MNSLGVFNSFAQRGPEQWAVSWEDGPYVKREETLERALGFSVVAPEHFMQELCTSVRARWMRRHERVTKNQRRRRWEVERAVASSVASQ